MMQLSSPDKAFSVLKSQERKIRLAG